MKTVYCLLFLLCWQGSLAFAGLDEAHTSIEKIPVGSQIVFQWDRIIGAGATSIPLTTVYELRGDKQKALSCELTIAPSVYLRSIRGAFTVNLAPGTVKKYALSDQNSLHHVARFAPYSVTYTLNFGQGSVVLTCKNTFLVSFLGGYETSEPEHATLAELRSLLSQVQGTLILAAPKPF